ncbi:uncharacterized protein [Diabrotica undecimpunctata]|uniref:uncharacterized protein n=1 Tax=Diabrotica undecimpunctata TaxID=50387 RepID=UPI003B63D3C5
MRLVLVLSVLSAIVALSYATVSEIIGGTLIGSLIVHKVAKDLGIGNIITIEADARAKLGKNEIGIDAAAGVGGDVVGYHANVDGDVLGQKVKVHGDIYDGDKVMDKYRTVSIDEKGRQYVLVRKWVGTNPVLVRQYIDTVDVNGKPVPTNPTVRRVGIIIEIRRPDGTIELHRPDGKILILRPGAVIYIKRPDGTVELRRPDGPIIEIRRPGTFIEVKKPDGTIVVHKLELVVPETKPAPIDTSRVPGPIQLIKPTLLETVRYPPRYPAK